MFKFVVICALLLATASAQRHGQGHGHGQSHGSSHGSSNNHAAASHHSGDDAHAEVTHYDADVHEHGFHYGYETTNHIKAVAAGDEHGNVHGDFQWISPEGEHIEVNYVADENGYQPKSDVLPTPHPIPVAILKSLEYIASHPHPEDEDQYGRKF